MILITIHCYALDNTIIIYRIHNGLLKKIKGGLTMKKVFSKKTMAAALTLILALAMAGCGSSTGTTPTATTPTATTSTATTRPGAA